MPRLVLNLLATLRSTIRTRAELDIGNLAVHRPSAT